MNAPAPTELLPCPFCGGPATLGGLPNGIIGYVRCRNDNCFGPKTTAVTKRDSIIQWNTRQAASVGAEQTEDYNSEAILAAGKRILARNQTKPVERAEVAGEAVGYVSPLTLKALLDDPAGAGPIVACAGYDTTIPLYASPSRSEGVSKGEVQIETAFLNLCEALGLQATPLAYLDAAAARAALNVAQAPKVPEGYALVPLVPTPRMVEVGCDNNPTQWNEGTPDGFAADVANDVYVSMVRASPVPPADRT